MLSDDIADVLTSGGIASASLFIYELPERPHTGLVVAPTGGYGYDRTMSASPANAPLERPSIQLRSRSTDAATAEALLMSAHVILNGMTARAVNANRYYYVRAVQTPMYLGRDDENRPMFSCNYDILRAESTA